MFLVAGGVLFKRTSTDGRVVAAGRVEYQRFNTVQNRYNITDRKWDNTLS